MSKLGTESMTKLTPHLVRLHESEQLYQLARDKSPQARAELGAAVTDLLNSTDLTVREQEIVADILISMLHQAERDLRQAISERLAAQEKAPLRVILYLSNDEIDVARPVLKNSPVLEDMDLMYIIQMRDAAYWREIAARESLNAPVICALVEKRDEETAVVLVNNDAITIPREAFSVLAEMAATGDDALKTPLLQRHDLPKDIVASLYAHAGRKLESELTADFGALPDPVNQAVGDVTLELVSSAHGDYTPTLPMMQAAAMLAERRQLNFESMMKVLKLGQIASFVAQMSVFLNIAPERVLDFLREESGETLAAICRVHHVDKRLYLKMYLLTERYRSGDRMVDPIALNRALSRFDQLSMDVCRRLIDTQRKSSGSTSS